MIWLTIGSFVLLNTSSALGANPVIYKDIQGSYAEKSVIRLTEQGMMDKLKVDKFAPTASISRVDFAVLLARVLGIQPFLTTKPTFNDLVPGSVEASYCEALHRLGVMQGVGREEFGPRRSIQRQEAATILKQALSPQSAPANVLGKYRDTGKIAPYAEAGVAFAVEQGWMRGNGNRLNPTRPLTRAEVAILCDRLLETRLQEAEQVLQPQSGRLVLRPGQSWSISSGMTFSTVVGTDNAAIGSLGEGGTVVAGNKPGTGTLTINEGNMSAPVDLVVSGSVYEKTGYYATLPLQDNDLPLTYQVKAHAPDTNFQKIEYKNYSGPVEGLISTSESWTGFLRQQGRDVLIDLGGLTSLTQISMEFKQDVNQGICYPQYMEAKISPDGKAWYRLGRATHGIRPTDRTVQTMILSIITQPTAARYIKLSFPTTVYVFARHLSVRGSSPMLAPVILAPVGMVSSGSGNYLKDLGFKDILLIFTGDSTELKILKAADFIPLIAYVRPSGEIKGRMFDTIQFMPYTGMPCTRDAWEGYLDDLYTPDRELDALNEAAACLRKAAGGRERVKVILTLPYPDSTQSSFGVLESGGGSLSFVTGSSDAKVASQNRLAAVKWYYDEMMARWNKAHYANLELAGIYWYKEAIDTSLPGEEELVRGVAKLVRNQQQNFIWIPFFGSPGLESWRDLGFTHAFLQPNYYATQDPPEDRMDRAAELARKYGTGIELECDNRILTTRYYYDLFYKELNRARALGLGRDTPNAYYIGFAQTLLDAANNDSQPLRQIYDDLHNWIAGKEQ